MIVSLKHNFVFLSMPKCASTSTETILRPFGQLTTDNGPEFKHLNYRRYERFIKPLIKGAFREDPARLEKLEVLCLFREPLMWVDSWYRYRTSSTLARRRDKAMSTASISFEEFARNYVSAKPKPFARIGRQIQFIKDRDGKYGNINVFRFEDYAVFMDYMSRKVGDKLIVPYLNVSPESTVDEIRRFDFLVEFLAEEYEFYRNLPKYS